MNSEWPILSSSAKMTTIVESSSCGVLPSSFKNNIFLTCVVQQFDAITSIDALDRPCRAIEDTSHL